MALPQSSNLVNMDTFARTMAVVGDSWGVVHILCLVWMMVMKVYSVYEYSLSFVFVFQNVCYTPMCIWNVCILFAFLIFNKNEFCGYFCCYPLKMQVGKSYAPTFSRLYLFLNLALCSQKV